MSNRLQQSGDSAQLPPALVLGLSPTGLIAIRSLGRRGVTVFGADLSRWAIGRFSRYCQYRAEISEIANQRDGDALYEALTKFAGEFKAKPVLYVTKDDFIEMLHPYSQRLKEHFLFSTDLGDLAATFLYKKSFYTLCQQHEVELPQTFSPSSVDEIPDIAARIQFPAIIKPASGKNDLALNSELQG